MKRNPFWRPGLTLLPLSAALALASTPGLADEETPKVVEETPAPVYAPGQEPITSEIFHRFTAETGYGPEGSRLGEDRTAFYNLRYEPSFAWYSPEKRWAKWQLFGRLMFNYSSDENSVTTQDENQRQVEGFSAEAREFYVRRNLLWDDARFSVSVGRQRYFDRFGIWWDDTLESVRFDYRDTFASGFVAIGEKFKYYNTKENSLDPREDDIAYLMGEYSYRLDANNWTGVRAQLQRDHSGDDTEDGEDFSGLRLGLFVRGDRIDSPFLSDYHLELATLFGRIETPTTIDNFGVVRQGDRENTRGWALLGEVGKQFPTLPWTPRISLRAGITDKPDDEFDGFRLNNLQSDRVTNPETYNTGAASSFVRLSMRNLAFYSLGVETRPHPRGHLDFRVSDIYQRNRDLGAASNQDFALRGLGARTNSYGIYRGPTADRSVGQVYDVNYFWEMFPIAHEGRYLNMHLLVNASYFDAGDAMKNVGDDSQVTVGVVVRY